jgi:drug/metabolite transporter (DMT)-like permease
MTREYIRRVPVGPLPRVLVGAVLLSFAPVLVKVADVGPTPAGFYRMGVGGVVLAAIVLARGGAWRGVGRRYLALCAVAGACFAADLAFWHRSIVYIGPGLATILANFQVFVLAVVGIVVLRERASPRLLVAIPVAIAGLFLIFGLDWGVLDTDYRWGVAFGLLTAVSYGSYLLTLRQARRRAGGADAMATVATLSLISAAILAALVWLEGETFAIPDLTNAGVLLSYAVVIQVVAWVLISSGLPGVAASRAGLVLLLQPTFAFVWDLVLFRRPTSGIELLGAVLTLVAIYLGLTGRPQGR